MLLPCSLKNNAGRGKSGYMGRLSSQENWLAVKRQLFAAMMCPIPPTLYIMKATIPTSVL